MGAKSSKTSDQGKLKRVFVDELATIDTILSHVLNKDNKFVEDGYNFLTQETCSRYSMVLESQLQRHLRIDVQALHDAVVLIPQQDRVKVGAQVVKKAELCDVVSKHYIQILYVLCLVKYVYNLEHSGDHSLAGIIARNVRIVGGTLLEVNYCAIPQKDYARHDRKIDFSTLQGMNFVLDHFLTPAERSVFLTQFKMLFRRVPLALDYGALGKAICRDPLLSQSEYAAIYGSERVSCDGSGVVLSDAEAEHQDTIFSVGALNPVLSTNVCMSKKKIVIPIGKDKASRQLHGLYDAMVRNYKANVLRVERDVLGKLVKETKAKASDPTRYTLKPINDSELADVVDSAKHAVVQFYLQSIVDYQRLLDFAMTLPTAKLDS